MAAVGILGRLRHPSSLSALSQAVYDPHPAVRAFAAGALGDFGSADGIAAPVPGLLAGGPNPGMQDKVPYPFTDPETAYIDDEKAYASNEIAINWNAPLVYVSAAFEALQRKAALSRK